MTADIVDPLLTMLRRHEAANAAFDASAARGDASEAESDRLFAACQSTSDAIVDRAPPATTAASAIAALDHVLADDTLWHGPDYPCGEVFLRYLIGAARDYIRRTA